MTLILSHSDVTAVLDRAEVLAAVERAHADLALGTALVPAPPAVTLGDAAFVPMVAAAESAGAAAVKLLADLPANRDRGLPVQRSVIVVTSAADGACEALIDGRLVTAVRTAAASAVATKHLSRQDSSTLGLIGAGGLAVEHTRAIARVRELETVLVWSRTTATVDRFRAAVADLGLDVRALPTPEAVTRATDILCTLTPAREPVVHGAWFGDGLHVNAVGAPPRADHREVDGAAMRRARVVVDSIATTLTKSGDTLLALAEGAITEAAVRTELGEVIAGRAPGRTADSDITLFNSVGIGLQDLAAARLLIDKARANGIGTEVDLSA
ncbi:alanine dehydrogenase [Nocardia neocaledoniensis NBRC 108232]|uniref:Ornithine cyclodeaminase/alanine dehydrogenase n=1 Tax=Nocardia neocaledoniensis TaxID=236511 RepID=A0A317NIG5_9NOCA|nr:ornithine cyclodeaminase family protein [Nocardia neocaledoniensis]PWV75216.1 ornithine cyclodeaminase/alanine dehydrogenase [Nocardia neocaledoniensis]GEM31725.1 alanine dehydrogenase [Nocardia neocaledoniensis NBRC 108232]